MAKLVELEIFQNGIAFVKAVYKITEKFPEKEKFNLTLHLNKTAVSIISNIAESYGRKTKKEKAYFLNIAIGSLSEAFAQLFLAKELKYISKEKFQKANDFIENYRPKILKFKHNLR